jgi:hypothetical protein
MTLDHLRTPHGELAAKIATTYHIDWLTYAYVSANGRVGLEGIFKKAYGKPIEMLESPNDTSYSETVKKEPLGDYDRETIERCVAQGGFEDYHLGIFLNDLCNKDILPPGEYVVTVSW